MTKTKLRIAAAMLAVLLLTCAWVGAVSAGVTYEFVPDDATASNIMGTPGNYWAMTGMGSSLPIKVTGDNSDKYLSGYHINTTIKRGDTLLTTGFSVTDLFGWSDTTSNPVQSHLDPVTGEYSIAAAVSSNGKSFKSIITPGEKIIKVGIDSVDGSNPYVIALSKMDFSTTSSNTLDSITGTGNVNYVTLDDTVRSEKFTLTPRVKPTVGPFSIGPISGGISDDSVNNGETFVVLRQGGLASDTLTGNIGFTSANYGSNWDTLEWLPSEASGDIYLVNTADDMKKTLTLSRNPMGVVSATVSAELNKGKDAADKTEITVVSAPWLISATDNYDNTQLNGNTYYNTYVSTDSEHKQYTGTAGTLGSWNDDAKWSFITPRKIEYVVNASIDVPDEWDSLMPKSLLWSGNEAANVLTADIPANEFVKSDTPEGTYTIAYSTDTVSSIKVTDGITSPRTADTTVTLTYTGRCLGDVKDDDSTNIVDSAVVGIQVIKNNPTPGTTGEFLTAEEYIYADCNSATPDGVINVFDILAINKYLVGIPPW